MHSPDAQVRPEHCGQKRPRVRFWLLLSSFLRYLDLVPDSPAVPSALTLRHVQGYLRQRASVASINRSLECQTNLRRVLIEPPLREMIAPDIHAALARSVPKFRS